jgi:hypothetical protein
MSSLSPELRGLSNEQKQLYRRRMETDPWYFTKYVCGHGTKAVERVHRPLLYLYTRQAALLAATLCDRRFDGYLTDQIKADLTGHGIDYTKPSNLPAIARRLRRVNVRLPRGAGKSVMADDANLWEVIVDPNIAISLGSKADPFVADRLGAIGAIVLSPEFGFWFPERVPENIRESLTNDSITLRGRTTTRVEKNIEGRGITSQWAGRHYNVNRRDDIVGTESGEASLEDALRHMADMSALRDKIDWRGDVYIGTVTGENDDHSMLLEDESVMNIVMPMEVHEGGTTVENVFDDGELTMPEWQGFSREGVNEIKNEAKKNTEHGPIYLLQNYYMVAHQTGVSLFTRSMLDKSLYRILENKESGESVILRPKKGRLKICQAQWPQQSGKRKRFNLEDWFVLDLKKLPYSAFGIAGDQSVTQNGSGDKWALGAVAEDWEGVFYLLDVVTGRGYQNFIDELPHFDRKYGGMSKVGLDANATQGMTIEWLKRDERYRDLSRRVEPIRSGGEAKDINIRNYVQSRMLSGGLFINPLLTDYHGEMLRYRPRNMDGKKKANVVDDQLDVTWMAMTLPTPPLSPESEDEMEVAAMMRADAERRDADPVTHIMSGSWLDAMWD